MEQLAKKPSLFKQRIAALRKEGKEGGFPTVVDLIDKDQPVITEERVPVPAKEEQEMKKGLVDLIKSQAILKEEDMRKIESDNWATIEAMGEEERLKMVSFINTEMKEGFVARIKKEPVKATPQPPRVEKPEPAREEKEEGDDSWEVLLKVNIETDRLEYTEENAQHLVSIPRISEMVGSQNNQSQIIGSKIASRLVSLLTSESTHKTRELVIVSHVPLHLSIIFEHCTRLLFLPMLRRARTTTFKSAFLEITAKAAEVLTQVKKYLSKDSLEGMRKPLEALMDKVNSFKIDKENTTAILDSLKMLCQLYQSYDASLEEQDWKNLRENCDFILELVLLQQASPSFLNTYALKIFQFVDRSSDLGEIISVEGFLYELVNKLLLRKNQELYINIDSFRNYWRPVIDAVVGRLLAKINNLELQAIFELIFLARFAGQSSWERILASLDHLSHIKPMVPHFLLFNTLSDQKAGLNEENLESLNAVLSWLASSLTPTCKLNPNYLLNTLIQLFLQEEEYYSQLDQQILLRFIVAVTLKPQTNIGPIFSQEKIRSLIKNYSFNSFGNEAFTNLMFLVAVRSSPQLQAMILRELIGRYVNNFLTATKSLAVPSNFLSSRSNQDIKDEILQQLDHSDSQSVLFLYLKA